jgi:adenosylcobinamide-phosphate synthase
VTGALVVMCWAAGAGVERLLGPLPAWLRLPLAALALKTTFAARALDEAAGAVRDSLLRGDLPQARDDLLALVSRDRSTLSAEGCASAAVESVAENLADSCVAPLLAYALFGLAGAAAYRAANTLDAMIGYRGEYEHLGKAAARLDDVLNLAPSRLSAAALVAGAALAGEDWRGAWRTARRDAGLTASPNAGWPIAAMAGALGVQLEKPGHYRLGDATRPLSPERIATSLAVFRRAVGATAVAAVALAWKMRSARCSRRA